MIINEATNEITSSGGNSVDGLNDEIIEPEDVSGDILTIKPYDPSHIRIITKNFTIREIYSQIESPDNELDLAPDFQRSFVWKERQQVRLIESILLGIPLPAFYFNQDKDGAHQVIDGVQRLTTVKRFMSNQLILETKHLEYLKDLGECSFEKLDPASRRRFSGTQIVAHVIEPQTPDEVKYDIFNRVNTGGSPLTAQEIRHCMSKSRSRSFLKKLVESDEFDKATKYAFWSKAENGEFVRNSHRMTDRELALRFCAFRKSTITEYEKSSSLDAFLLDFTRKLDNPQEIPNLAILKKEFNQAMENSEFILGEYAFRRCLPGVSRRGPINRAIFESQALALADYSQKTLEKHKKKIYNGFRSLFLDEKYDAAVRSGTGDARKIQRRIEKTHDMLREILSDYKI